jgi:hypothetical protein
MLFGAIYLIIKNGKIKNLTPSNASGSGIFNIDYFA